MKLCIGMIGEHRFCLASGICRTKSHASRKFKMGCSGGWFIPGKSQVLINIPTAFTSPFLDVAKVTDKTLVSLKDSSLRNTTTGWEGFIAEAKEEWTEFVARQPLRIVEERSSDEDGDDESGSVEGDLFDGSPPSLDEFKWKTAHKKLPKSWSGLFMEARKSGTKTSTTAEDIEELQAAVEDLAEYYTSLSEASRADDYELLEYVWLSVGEVIKAIDRINGRVQGWKEVIGQEERGALDICSELWSALSQINGLELGLNARVEDLSERFEEWEGDNVSNLMLLNDKIKELRATQAAITTATPHQGTASISFSTPITDESGERIGELGDFLSDMQALKTENVALQADLGAIKADLKAQGARGHRFWPTALHIRVSTLYVCNVGVSPGRCLCVVR
jgi:hypothetical protein